MEFVETLELLVGLVDGDELLVELLDSGSESVTGGLWW